MTVRSMIIYSTFLALNLNLSQSIDVKRSKIVSAHYRLFISSFASSSVTEQSEPLSYSSSKSGFVVLPSTPVLLVVFGASLKRGRLALLPPPNQRSMAGIGSNSSIFADDILMTMLLFRLSLDNRLR